MESKPIKVEDVPGPVVFLVVLVLLACVNGWFDGGPETEDAGDGTNVTQSSEESVSDSLTSDSEPEPTGEKPPPKPSKSKSPERKIDLCGAPENPFGYNFCGNGGLVHDPVGGVCAYFDCIDYFENGKGYMVQCGDNMYSMSGGRRGVCSYHDGHQQDVFGG